MDAEALEDLPDGPAAQTCCPVINFFASAASAATYQRAHPDVTGQILTPAEAVAVGRQVFGSAGIPRACVEPDRPDPTGCGG
ncbi:MAG: alkylmercury lyase family protein [Meiothermus silvanus]|nr:alkylmercury lyase family protein [Allomeiothermus silvanus]